MCELIGELISIVCVCVVQVDLHREFVFRNSKKTYNGVPIIASNMDTVGTFEMACALSQVTSYTSQTPPWFFKLTHSLPCSRRYTSTTRWRNGGSLPLRTQLL